MKCNLRVLLYIFEFFFYPIFVHYLDNLFRSVAKSAAKEDRNLSQAVASASCNLEELDEM